MTRKELQKRYLITCKGDESIEKKIEKAAKGAKLRVKTNKGSEFGSGMHSSKNGSNMLKKNKRLPEIKRLERMYCSVLLVRINRLDK